MKNKKTDIWQVWKTANPLELVFEGTKAECFAYRKSKYQDGNEYAMATKFVRI